MLSGKNTVRVLTLIRELVIFRAMKHTFQWAIALSLIPQWLLVQFLSLFPEVVEDYYSGGIYRYLSGFFRILYGWIPFSVGDLLYALLIILLIVLLIRQGRTYFNRPWLFVRSMLMVVSVAYFSFNLLWGLNYYRIPLHETLGISDQYTPPEVARITSLLIARTNSMQQTLAGDSIRAVEVPYTREEVMARTLQGYEQLKEEFPGLAYNLPSLKQSLFGTILSYMGYGGYLNPFTNEAQVNGRLPLFRYPVVCGHEIGHQLGYSAENETNFIGYLVTLRNSDPYFQYAAYAYATAYCLADLKKRDEVQFELLYNSLNKGVQANYRELTEFWESYANPLEPMFKSIFNTFLKVNNQEDGIESYNRVVSLMVTYHQLHGFPQSP